MLRDNSSKRYCDGVGVRVESRWPKGPNLTSSQWIEWRCLFPLLTSGKKEKKNVIRDHFPLSLRRHAPPWGCSKERYYGPQKSFVLFSLSKEVSKGALQNCEVLGQMGVLQGRQLWRDSFDTSQEAAAQLIYVCRFACPSLDPHRLYSTATPLFLLSLSPGKRFRCWHTVSKTLLVSK